MTWGRRRAIIIFVLIVFFVVFIWVTARMGGSSPRVESNSVLVIDAEGAIEEQRPIDIFTAFGGERNLVLHDYLDGIDRAAAESHITGLVVRIHPLATGWGKLEEIRTHLLGFRKSGKPNVCYLGADGIGNAEYYLASACDKVWLVPTAPVSIHGMMAEALFMRGTLDKLKIVPEFYHIAEYKTATNMLTERKFTPAHKEEVEGLLQSVYHQYLTETSQARHLDAAKLEAILNRAPLSAEEAVDSHVVDRLAYWDQVQDFFEQSKGWNPISLRRYRAAGSMRFETGEKIAVIQATGLIVSGQSQNTAGGGFIMGGDSVAADIRRAKEDSSIKAIVLRIDSGGGSAVASEVIRREVVLAKARKPVVVSMSDVAASGGYWIAMDADKIVADPNTITASIGVLIGKLNISGLYNLLGLSTDYVATSENATLFSDQQNFTPAQQAYIEKSLRETYANFTKGVADGRKMTVAAVDKIGKGRVWSGAQAKEIGLVDELGGFDRAIEVAKQLAHIPARNSVRIVRFPEEKSFLQLLVERQQDNFTDSSTAEATLDATIRRLVRVMEPVQARVPFELHIR
jgi:protease IV